MLESNVVYFEFFDCFPNRFDSRLGNEVGPFCSILSVCMHWVKATNERISSSIADWIELYSQIHLYSERDVIFLLISVRFVSSIWISVPVKQVGCDLCWLKSDPRYMLATVRCRTWFALNICTMTRKSTDFLPSMMIIRSGKTTFDVIHYRIPWVHVVCDRMIYGTRK